ncbi:ROK family transcriptional regulator [Sulfitobacter sp.]|uniref:ROK family transcriptional regulator n=1 Tax=Sulfitobacter sp. TaxID=1903071 RepID=UPI0030025337
MPKDAITYQRAPTRSYNERLFIELIRKAGQMSKAELTRASGLSAQSATVIVNRLVAEGLLRAGTSVKGKVGQPSTPYSLDPDGALSIGVKVGRRSLEVVSMAFDYTIIRRTVRRYEFPQLETIRQDLMVAIAEQLDDLSSYRKARVVGIGIARPDDLSAWEETVGAPKGAMAGWAQADLSGALSAQFNLPVRTLNDASAACLAEIAVGNSARHDTFAYFYIGTFIGGGIALGGRLYNGRHNLAGSFASTPKGAVTHGIAPQLLERTSLRHLEQQALAVGVTMDSFYKPAMLEPKSKEIFNKWLEEAAPQIAFAAVCAQAFIDPDAIVIDSSLSPALTLELINAVETAIATLYDKRGLAQVKVVAGENGIAARAIGSGILSFLSQFGLEPT